MECVAELYGRADPAHDLRHIQRITDRLGFFSEHMNPELRWDLLYFLACWHGLGKKITTDYQFSQQTKQFLASLGWTNDEIREAFACLERHLKNPVTPEEKIVHDANYVELLGAFGIAKAFTTGGAKGQSYEETAHIFEYEYLDKIKFQTINGKILSEKRRNYAREFLKQLRSEL
jgi:HD superfamily phosphodiesterase